MKGFKYIQNVTAEEGTIRLYKRIGSTIDSKGDYVDGVNGADFANEMAYLQQVCAKINIRINSGGGNVLDAYAIVSSIINSTVPCDTYIDGLAASAAAVIAVAGKKCYMVDYGTFMIHNAIDAGGDTPKEIMDIFNASMNTILTNRTGKSSADISAMMSKETWLSAAITKQRKELLDSKIVDEIVSTKKKIKVPNTTNVAELEMIYNEVHTNPVNMKEINALVNLAIDNTDESAVASAIKTIKAENIALKASADIANAKVTALEKEKTDSIEAGKVKLTADVTAFVNQLVVDKKAKEEEKVAIIANASASPEAFEFVKNTYAKISNMIPAKVIFDPSKVENNGSSEDRTTWDFAKWSQNDPQGLLKIQNEHPADFEKLVKTIKTNGVTSR